MDNHFKGYCTEVKIKVGCFKSRFDGKFAAWFVACIRRWYVNNTRNFDEFTAACIYRLKMDTFPEIVDDLTKCAASLALSRPQINPLPGCAVDLDGISVRIVELNKSFMPHRFWYRKGFYSLPVQAIVYSQYLFMTVSIICVRSTHDSMESEVSNMEEFLRNGHLPHGFLDRWRWSLQLRWESYNSFSSLF